MKFQTFFLVTVLLAFATTHVSAGSTAPSALMTVFMNRDEFTAQGYFLDVNFDFNGNYLDIFRPIGSSIGGFYVPSVIEDYNYPNYYWGLEIYNPGYFNYETVPLFLMGVSSFKDGLSEYTDYLVGGIGNGYIFSAGTGIGLSFGRLFAGVQAAGFFLEATGNLVDEYATMAATVREQGTDLYLGSLYYQRATSHVQFWGAATTSFDYYLRSLSFQWGDLVEPLPDDSSPTSDTASLKTRGDGGVDPRLSEDFYKNKAELVTDDPALAGIKHVLISSYYYGGIIEARSINTDETIVNIVDHQAMSLNMLLTPVEYEAVFTVAAFTLADGAQVLVEALPEGNFSVSLDGADITEGSVIAGADFTVRYDQFDNLPRTGLANGQSWFDRTFDDQEHTAVVRVVTSDLVVDVSLSIQESTGISLLNANMRELNLHSPASGLLKTNAAATRMAAHQERSVDSDLFEKLLAAHTVDSLF